MGVLFSEYVCVCVCMYVYIYTWYIYVYMYICGVLRLSDPIFGDMHMVGGKGS